MYSPSWWCVRFECAIINCNGYMCRFVVGNPSSVTMCLSLLQPCRVSRQLRHFCIHWVAMATPHTSFLCMVLVTLTRASAATQQCTKVSTA